jgi:surface antigen
MIGSTKKTAVVLVALLAAGCGGRMSNSEMIGAAAGAAAGGLIGWQFGSGFGQAVAIAVGTVAGGAAGYVAARRLMPSDRAEYDRTTHLALAEAKDGETRDWINPETGTSGIVRPTRSYQADGRTCREYRAAVAFEKDVHAGTGVACLQADGRWLVVSDVFS